MTTNFISFPHPRILIVENEEGTVANLKGKLKRAIPNVSVDSAANVTEGQNKLNAAYDSLRFYTIVILDFKLPLDCTSATEIGDFSLWFLRDLCPETLVIHMTAMPDDVDFQRMRPSMETFASSLRIYFGKDEYEWAEKLVAACAKHVEQKRIHFHSDRLRMDFDRLFGPHSGDRLSRSSGRSDTPRGDQSLSLEIAGFCDDVGNHWNTLDASLQESIGNLLGHTVDSDGRHYVGVVCNHLKVETFNSKKLP